MTQKPVMVRCNLSGLVHTESKHSFFVDNCLKITNCVHEFNFDVPFMVVLSNFSNTSRKIPKQMFVGYATRITNLIILLMLDSSFVAHVHE